MLEIPPIPGQTIIPRLSMVSADGINYVFVRKPGDSQSGSSTRDSGDRFERRSIDVAQEDHDRVVVARGLNPGEEVVTVGSLILAQLYDDTLTVSTGLPAN